MRRWILIAMSSAVLASMTISTAVTAFDPIADCSDDDSCPPFSDDCGDCAQCFHMNAVPAVVGVSVLMIFAREIPQPVVFASRMPLSPPSREILTVPRA